MNWEHCIASNSQQRYPECIFHVLCTDDESEALHGIWRYHGKMGCEISEEKIAALAAYCIFGGFFLFLFLFLF
jgi:hypothetical protein